MSPTVCGASRRQTRLGRIGKRRAYKTTVNKKDSTVVQIEESPLAIPRIAGPRRQLQHRRTGHRLDRHRGPDAQPRASHNKQASQQPNGKSRDRKGDDDTAAAKGAITTDARWAKSE